MPIIKKYQEGKKLSYTEWYNLPEFLRQDERYLSRLDPNIRKLIDVNAQRAAINTGETGSVPVAFDKNGKPYIVGDGGRKISDPSQMRAGVENFPINYGEEWATDTKTQYLQPAEAVGSRKMYQTLMQELPKEERELVSQGMTDIQNAYETDEGIREAVDSKGFSKNGEVSREALYSMYLQNPDLFQSSVDKVRSGETQIKQKGPEENYSEAPQKTGVAFWDDVIKPTGEAIAGSVKSLWNNPNQVKNIPHLAQMYSDYWLGGNPDFINPDYHEKGLKSLEAAQNILNVAPVGGGLVSTTGRNMLKGGLNLARKGRNIISKIPVNEAGYTIGQGANWFNKNVMKKKLIPKASDVVTQANKKLGTNINPSSKIIQGVDASVDKTFKTLNKVGIDNSMYGGLGALSWGSFLKGQNTYGDILSGNYDPSRSAFGRLATGEGNMTDVTKAGLNFMIPALGELNAAGRIENYYANKALVKGADKIGVADKADTTEIKELTPEEIRRRRELQLRMLKPSILYKKGGKI